MFRNARLRIASAMAQIAALTGLTAGPEIQYSPQAMQAPKFRMAPRAVRRGRMFWPSSRAGTYVRLQGYQVHCNKNFFRKRKAA